MKRAKFTFILTLITALVLTLTLCACSKGGGDTEQTPPIDSAVSEKPSFNEGDGDGGEPLTVTPDLVFTYLQSTDSYLVGTDTDANGNAYAGIETAIVIPSVYDDGEHGEKAVTAIGTRAFSNRKTMVSIYIPDSVTLIKPYAFNNCSSIVKFTVPDSVTEISSFAFYNCTSLEEIVLPFVGKNRETKDRNDSVFGYIFGNTTVATDKTTNQIYNNSNANANYYIPSSVKKVTVTDADHISYGGFYNCSYLEEITLNKEITSIDVFSMYGCGRLKKLVLPFTGTDKTQKETANSVFGSIFGSRRTSISDVTLQYYSATGALYYFIPRSLTEVTVLGNDDICYGVFYGCKYLQKITLNEGIDDVAVNAFRDCTALTSVNLPSTVTHVGRSAFSNTGVYTAATDKPITYIGNWVIDYTGNLTVETIPEGITGIADNAFTNNISISSITLPTTLAYIGENAFSGVKGDIVLTSGCKFKKISDYAFADSGLKSIAISNECTVIGKNAFQNCTEIETAITLPLSIKTVSDYALFGISADITFENGSSVDKIGAYSFYASGIKSIPLSDECTEIPDYAFYNCKNIGESFVIPASVKRVGDFAFDGVTAEINMEQGGNGLDYVGSNAFISSGIKKIYFSTACAAIADYAFYSCLGLDNLVLPSSVKSIGKSAFENTTCNLSFAEGSALDNVSENAFRNSNLIAVTLSDNCLSLPPYAFADCDNLTSLVVPNSVTSIGTGILYNCNNLENLSIPFVGKTAAAADSFDSVFGYIFSYSVTQGAGKTYQCYTESYDEEGNFFRSGYHYYIPSSLKNVAVTAATQIPYGAFYNCSNLESLSLSDGTEDIGDYAFFGCTGLTSIDLPSSLEKIGKYAFKNVSCSFDLSAEGFEIVTLSEGSFDSSGITGITLAQGMTTIPDSAFSNSDLINVIIPSTVETISKNAFSSCLSLSGVIFEEGSSLVTVEVAAFYNCSDIASVELPASVLFIKSSAFYGVRGSIVFEEGSAIQELGIYSFAESGLLSIRMAANISDYLSNYRTDMLSSETEILATTFKNCNYLTSVIVDFDSPQGRWTPDIFSSNPAIFVPGGRMPVFKEAVGWTNYADSVFDITTVNLNNNYVISADGRSFVRYLGDSDTYTIPESTNISVIGSYAFSGNTTIKEIILPSNVRILSPYAFYGCVNLERIVFNGTNRLTDIYDHAFYKCNKLALFNLSGNSGLMRIGESAFFGCTALSSIFIPKSVTTIGGYAFSGIDATVTFADNADLATLSNYTFSNYSGDALVLPKNLTAIGNFAFAGCTSSVSFAENALLATIASYAFSDYKGISISLPSGLTTVASYAFRNCVNLKTLIIPRNVVSIGVSAFRGCNALTSLSLPFVGESADAEEAASAVFGYVFGYSSTPVAGAVEQAYSSLDSSKKYYYYIPSGLATITLFSANRISTGAFQNMTSLSSIVLNDGITKISARAFNGCTALPSVNLPDSLISIGKDAFLGSGVFNGEGLIYADNWLVGTADAEITSASLSVGATGIADYALYGCADLISLSLNDGLVYIGEYALANCSNASLASLTLPKTLQKIGKNAFSGCKAEISFAADSVIDVITEYSFAGYGATAVALPESVNEIRPYAFASSARLEEVFIPDSVTVIGEGAFKDCLNVKEITLPFVGRDKTSGGTFAGVFGYIFGFERLESLIPATPIITPTPQSFNSLSTFYYYIPVNLESVTLTSAEEIPYGAFSNLTSTCSLIINEGVTRIFSYAFKSYAPTTPEDQAILLPSTVATIDEYAFDSCTAKVVFPTVSALTDVEAYAFSNYAFTGGITIPSYIENIGEGAYKNAANVTSLSLPSSGNLLTLGSSAFQGLKEINSVIIPKTVTDIGDYAFSGCTKLNDFTVEGNSLLDSVGIDILSGCNSLSSLSVPFLGKASSDNGTASAALGYYFGKGTSLNSTRQIYSASDSISYAVPSSLKNVTLTASEIIPFGAFSNCTALETVTYDASVVRINPYAFYNCSALNRLNGSSAGVFKVESSVVFIGEFAFYGCNLMTDLYIPFVGENAIPSSDNKANIFGSIFGYGTAYFSGMVKQFYDDGEYDFINCYIPTALENVTVTNAETLSQYAFNNCTGISSITLNDEISDIEKYAFKNITSTVVIGNSSEATVIKPYAFAYYLGSTVNLSGDATEIQEYGFYEAEIDTMDFKNVGVIGDYAFAGCSNLIDVELSSYVTSIGEGAFIGCSSVYTIRVNASAAPALSGVFNTTDSAFPNTAKVLVPVGSRTNYLSADSWISYVSIVFEPGEAGQTYKLSSDGKNLESYWGSDTSFTIPTGVEVINEGVFLRSGLNSIIFNNTVTTIGAFAFSEMPRLTSITIPNTVTEIAVNAFRGTALTSIYLPFIGKGPSYYGTADGVLGAIFGYESTAADGLISQRFGEALTDVAYYYVPSTLTTVNVTNAETIPYGAFSGCANLTKVSFGATVSTIKKAAFLNASSITKINTDTLGKMVIPDTVTTVEAGAFKGVNKITSATLPFVGTSRTPADDVEKLFGAIFGYTLENETTGQVKQRYGEGNNDQAYFNIPAGLVSVTVSSASTTIPPYAFNSVSTLTSVTLDDTVTTIGNYAFYKATGLSSFTLPSELNALSRSVFEGASSLQSVVIPNLVVTIEEKAFFGCTSLASLTFESESILETLKSDSFGSLSALRSIILPDSLLFVGDGALSSSSLESITLPYLGESISLISSPKTVFGHIFGTSDTNKTGYTRQRYAEGAEKYYNIPSTLTSVSVTMATSLSYGAFSYCSKINNFVLPSLDTISPYAFYKCAGLTNGIEIPDSTYGIGAYAFAECSNLTIAVPSSVKIVSDHAFYKVLNPIIDENMFIDFLEPYAFAESGITALSLSGSCTTIPDGAFMNCKLLTGFTLPSSVTSVGINAFNGCLGLLRFNSENDNVYVIPDTVQSIGFGAFGKCPIVDLTIPFIGKTATESGTLNAVFGHIFGAGVIGEGTKQYYSPTASYTYDVPAGLTDLTITGTASIPYGAFNNCSGIENISITIKPGLCSHKTKLNSASTIVSSCDCNVFTSINTGSLVQSYSSEIQQSTIDLFDDLGAAFNAFLADDSDENFNSFFTTAKSIFNVSNTSITKNLNYAITDGALIGINNETSYRYIAGEALLSAPENLKTVLSALFGCDSAASFNELAQTLADAYKENAGGAHAPHTGDTSVSSLLAYKGTVLAANSQLTKNLFIVPVAFKNQSNDVVLAYVLATGEGKIYVWINDVEDAFNVANVEDATYNTTVTEEPSAVELFGRCLLFDVSAIDAQKIGEAAFDGASGLESISIVSQYYDITTIGARAFSNCSNLLRFNAVSDGLFNIYKTVSTIGENAFLNVSNVEILFESDTVYSSVAKNTFSGFNGSKITLPSSVTEIFESAFKDAAAEVDASAANFTELGASAFENYDGTTVKLPNNLTVIGEKAFYGAANLINLNNRDGNTEFYAPASLTTIGDSAFSYCAALSSVITGDSGLLSIGANAFSDCAALNVISLPATLKTVGERAFYSITAEIRLLSGLDSVGAYAFCQSGLKNLALTTNCTAIYDYTFNGCEFDTASVIPESVKYVGAYAFENVTSAISFASGSEIDFLGEAAFKGSGLTAIKLSSTCTVLPRFALSATDITTFEASSLTSIEAYALSDNTSLLSVVLPSSLNVIREFALYGCSGLTDLTIPFIGGDSVYESAYDDVLGYIFGSSTEAVDAFTVEQRYGNGATDGRYYAIPSGLQNITVTDSVQLPYGGLFNLSSMVKLTLQNTAFDTLSPYALFNCAALSKINSDTAGKAEFTSSLKTVGTYALSGCATLTEINIPSSVTSLESFALFGCTALQKLYVPFIGATPDTTPENKVFGAIFGYSEYEEEDTTKQRFANTLSSYYYIPTTLTSVTVASAKDVPFGAFDACSTLTEINLPSNYDAISHYAFNGCSSLVNLTIPSTVSFLGGYAFYDAFTSEGSLTFAENSKLTVLPTFSLYRLRAKNLILPDELTEIEATSLNYASNLTDLTIPARVTAIGSGAFANSFASTGTTTLRFAEGAIITTIPIGAFTACNITNFELPVSVISIENRAFMNCARLTSVQFTTNLTTIKYQAFDGCSALTNVVLPSNLNRLGISVFANSGLISIELLSSAPPEIIDTTDNTTALGGSGTAEAILPASCTTIVIPRNALASYNLHPVWYTYSVTEKE